MAKCYSKSESGVNPQQCPCSYSFNKSYSKSESGVNPQQKACSDKKHTHYSKSESGVNPQQGPLFSPHAPKPPPSERDGRGGGGWMG